MGNGALPNGPSYRAHPRLYHLRHDVTVGSSPLTALKRKLMLPLLTNANFIRHSQDEQFDWLEVHGGGRFFKRLDLASRDTAEQIECFETIETTCKLSDDFQRALLENVHLAPISHHFAVTLNVTRGQLHNVASELDGLSY